jgi:hypothetical protein
MNRFDPNVQAARKSRRSWQAHNHIFHHPLCAFLQVQYWSLWDTRPVTAGVWSPHLLAVLWQEFQDGASGAFGELPAQTRGHRQQSPLPQLFP